MAQTRFPILLAALLFLSAACQRATGSPPADPGTQPPSPTSAPTFTITPAWTHTVTNTATSTNTATPEAVPTAVRSTDGMVMANVAAGEFEMGRNTGFLNEYPAHVVFLDEYWIDQTEVTNAMYARCVAAGRCNLPAQSRSPLRNDYFGNPQFGDYPVIHVNWNDAAAYCAWAGARLPTEAEWEKAARGTDGRDYPWGNGEPFCERANTLGCVGDTSRVGSYPSWASPYQVSDMAGNVSEWVADWYDETYYSNSPLSNPLGPSFGMYRVLRGGSWANASADSRTARRDWIEPVTSTDYYGFRCAQSTSP